MTKTLLEALSLTRGKGSMHLRDLYELTDAIERKQKHIVRGCLSTLKKRGVIFGGNGDGYYWV